MRESHKVGMFEATGDYLVHLQRRGRSPHTIAAYARKLRAAARAGAPEHLTGSPAYRASVIRHVRAYLRWAIRVGKEPHDALELWQPYRAPQKATPTAITEEDFQKLIGAARTPRDRALLILLRDTGARIGALCALRWEDINEAQRYAITATKGARAIRLHLTPRALSALRALRAQDGAGSLVFGGLTPNGAYQALRRIARRAGVARFNPHAFRHAFARDMLLRGCDLARVSRLLGHSNIGVTVSYYAIFAADELSEAYQRFWAVQAEDMA